MALTVNIARWIIVLRAINSFADLEFRVKVRFYAYIVLVMNGLFAFATLTVIFIGIDQPLYYPLMIQALCVQPVTALFYIYIWRALSSSKQPG